MAVLAAGACLVIAAGGTAVAALLPGRPVTVAPAGPPSLRLGPSSTSPPPMRDLPLPGRTTLGAPTMPSGGSLESTYPPTTQPPSYPTRTSPSSP
ncbi:hypothetical protein [Streptantibioticus cattleyicolor]|nr:hypothetical protein [Streptantibioticus cattleyicolor]